MLIIGCDFHPGFQQAAILAHQMGGDEFCRGLPAGVLVD